MTKVYKIGNKEIKSLDLKKIPTADDIEVMYIERFNQLLEALSDKEEPKQEECEKCPHDITPTFTDKDLVTVPKQSTSLKEEIIETIWTSHGQSTIVPNTADKILSLIQSHLVKEIENLTQETVLDDLKREFPVLYKQDIIKIINNIIK